MQFPYYQRERYNELPEPQRALLDSMEKYISSQMQIKHELRARSANESMRQLMGNVHELMSEQQALSAALEADSMKLQSVVGKVEQDRHDNAMMHQVALHARDKLSDGNGFVDWLRRFAMLTSSASLRMARLWKLVHTKRSSQSVVVTLTLWKLNYNITIVMGGL